MKFEDLFQYIGDFGTYQKRIYFIAVSIAIANAFQQMVVVFSLTEPNSRCAVPGLSNDTYASQGVNHEELLNLSIPWESDNDGHPVRSKCRRYSRDLNNPGRVNIVDCDAWVYDKNVFELTATSEFNMVCSDKQKQSHAKMMMFGGMMVGAIALGAVSDLFGRRKTLFGALFFHVSFAIGLSFAPSFEVFAAVRFLLGIAHSGVFLSAFVIGMELVGPSRRALAGIGIKFYYVTGLFILGGVAYGVRNWHYLHLAVSVPNIIFISFYWILPESPRWLLQKGRIDEAEAIIRKAAQVNKVELPDKIFDNESVKTATQHGKIMDLFTNRILFCRCLIVFINWMVISMMYYGLTLNVSNLSGNIYINFEISNTVEFAGYIILVLILEKVGRKKVHCTAMVVGGLACVLTIFPVLYAGSEKGSIILALAMVGRMGASSAFTIIYIFTAELFPTVVRNSVIGWGSVFARVGGILSPYIADLGKLVGGKYATVLPLLVFGAAAMIAGVLSLWLPETLHKPIPDTIEEAKHFGKNNDNKNVATDLKEKDNTELTGVVNETYTTDTKM